MSSSKSLSPLLVILMHLVMVSLACPLSVPYLHLLVRLRAFEESIKAKSRYTDPADVRAERAYIRECVKEILAP